MAAPALAVSICHGNGVVSGSTIDKNRRLRPPSLVGNCMSTESALRLSANEGCLAGWLDSAAGIASVKECTMRSILAANSGMMRVVSRSKASRTAASCRGASSAPTTNGLKASEESGTGFDFTSSGRRCHTKYADAARVPPAPPCRLSIVKSRGGSGGNRRAASTQ